MASGRCLLSVISWLSSDLCCSRGLQGKTSPEHRSCDRTSSQDVDGRSALFGSARDAPVKEVVSLEAGIE